jgi:predicted peptidase
MSIKDGTLFIDLKSRRIGFNCMLKFIFLVTMTLSLSASAQNDPLRLFEKSVYRSGQEELPYRLLKPAGAKTKKLFPLVIFMHGAGERGADNEAQIRHIHSLFLNADNRSKYPCYVLAPQCPQNSMWANFERGENGLRAKRNPTPPMRLLIELIDKVAKEFPVDPSRIYVTGVSMGGFGTWDLIGRFPDRFAAAIPVCGGGDTNTGKQIKHIPVWAFHGALDEVVYPSQSRVMIKALQDAGGKPGYTEYPDVEHDSWVYAYQEPHLLPWLFSKELPRK